MENATKNKTLADLAGTMFVMLAMMAYFHSEDKPDELSVSLEVAINFINEHGPSVAAGYAATQNIPMAEADEYAGNTIGKCIEIVEATVEASK